MRLSILAASVPTALLAIACDDGAFERTSPTTAPAIAEATSSNGRRALEVAVDWQLPGADRWDTLPATARPGAAWHGRRTGHPVEPVDLGTATPMNQCDASMQAGWAAIHAADVASSGCNTDLDCTVDVVPSSCGGLDIFAVSFAGASAFEAAMDDIDQSICATRPPECPIAMPSIVGQPQAACVANQCELRFQSFEEAEAACNDTTMRRETTEGCLSCELATQKAYTALNAVVEDFNACDADDDCVHASDDTGCISTCGVAVNREQLGAFNEARVNIAADYCTGGTCPIAMAGCLPQKATCEAGRCEMVAEPW